MYYVTLEETKSDQKQRPTQKFILTNHANRATCSMTSVVYVVSVDFH